MQIGKIQAQQQKLMQQTQNKMHNNISKKHHLVLLKRCIHSSLKKDHLFQKSACLQTMQEWQPKSITIMYKCKLQKILQAQLMYGCKVLITAIATYQDLLRPKTYLQQLMLPATEHAPTLIVTQCSKPCSHSIIFPEHQNCQDFAA